MSSGRAVLRGTAYPPAAGCAKRHPCCRGGPPSYRRPRSCASVRCSTRTTMLTPGDSSSPFSRVNTLTSTTMPCLAVRHTQGGVADLARLLAEDRAEQTLLSGQLGLALRGDLADQDIAGVHLGADADDAALVQVACSASSPTFGMSRVISSGSELGIAGLGLVLLDMDRGVYVIADQTLVDAELRPRSCSLPRS